jgi:hypothetical protein
MLLYIINVFILGKESTAPPASSVEETDKNVDSSSSSKNTYEVAEDSSSSSKNSDNSKSNSSSVTSNNNIVSLFILGLKRGLRYQDFVTKIKSSSNLLVLFAVNFFLIFCVFGFIASKISSSESSPFSYYLFIFPFWFAAVFVLNNVFSGLIVADLRKSSSYLKDRNSFVYPSSPEDKNKNILNIISLVVLIIQKLLVPGFVFVILSVVFGFLQFLVYGVVSVFFNLYFAAFLLLSPFWSKVSIDLTRKEKSDENETLALSWFPESPSNLEYSSFIDKNFPYFFGFVFPIVVFSYFIVPFVHFLIGSAPVFSSPLSHFFFFALFPYLLIVWV